MARPKRSAWACEHTDRPNCSRGLCRSCFSSVYSKKHYAKNLDYHKARKRAKRIADPVAAHEQDRRVALKSKYGITPAEYDRMLAAQRGLCAICGGPPNGRWPRLAVDHDHATDRVRELLCNHCNTGIGLLGGPDVLEKAAAYLRRHSGEAA